MPASADWMTSRGAAEITKNENRYAVEAALEELDQRRNVAGAAARAAGLDQVLAPDAAELGIVANQVGELAPLLDEVAPGQAVDLLLETRGAPSSSLRTSPESLKLSVWSKSDATRKCRRTGHVVPAFPAC